MPGFSSNQRVPNSCATLTGGTCIFPFTYNGATHYQCTYTDSPTPWCATAVDSSGVVVTNGWGDCEVSATSACQTESITVPTCTTSSGIFRSYSYLSMIGNYNITTSKEIGLQSFFIFKGILKDVGIYLEMESDIKCG